MSCDATTALLNETHTFIDLEKCRLLCGISSVHQILPKQDLHLQPVNKFWTRNGGRRWQVNKTKTNLLHWKNKDFVISWLKTSSAWVYLHNYTIKLTMSGPISLTSDSKKKSLKGFMRTIRLKLDHKLQGKLSVRKLSLRTFTTCFIWYFHLARRYYNTFLTLKCLFAAK